jgi:type III secretory pathway lipoprotein EscJ
VVLIGFKYNAFKGHYTFSAISIQKALILLSVSAFLLCGCESRIDLTQGVSQRQSLQIVSVLSKHGINGIAKSGQGNGKGVTISVPSPDYARATTVLFENGLPAEDEQSISDLLETSSFLPQTRLIEALRVDRALSLEIREHLMALAGVFEVKVMVRSDPYGTIDDRGVSVLVFTKESYDAARVDRAVVEQHVATSFPDLRRDRLTISVMPAKEVISSLTDNSKANKNFVTNAKGNVLEADKNIPQVGNLKSFLGLWYVEGHSYLLAAGIVVLFFIVSIVVGIGLAFWWEKLTRTRVQKVSNSFQSLSKSADKIRVSDRTTTTQKSLGSGK